MSFDVYTAAIAAPKTEVATSHDKLMNNIERACDLIDGKDYCKVTASAPGVDREYEEWAPTKLVCFPESHLHGWPNLKDHSLTIQEWNERGMAIRIPGPETDRLAEAAEKNDVFVQAVSKERIPEFPDLQFNTAFIINPDGEIILKYRKVSPAIHFELSTSPWDVLDKYMEVFGEDKSVLETLYPVVETEIGKLGVIICNDGHYPESYRALAMQGAEVIIHGEWVSYMGKQPRNIWEITNRAAAWSNCCYLVCPTTPKIDRPGENIAAAPGYIIDYNAEILTEVPRGHEAMYGATIRLDHLRRRRQDPGRNLLSHIKSGVWGEMYEEEVYPSNLYEEEENVANELSELHKRDTASLGIIDKLTRRGVYTPPDDD